MTWAAPTAARSADSSTVRDAIHAMASETIFTLEATPVKFGPGAADDAGWELQRLGVTRALLVTDPGVAVTGHPDRVRDRIAAAGIAVVVYDRARVEPTLDSLQYAADFARDAGVDGFVSVGGGSSIDTLKVKTGISHRYLRPAQAIVDPELAQTLGAEVTASSGLDVVCHAAESFLSRPYDQRERPASPGDRPPYQGANPVADVWSAKALEYGGRYLRRAVADPGDVEARGRMMLAATMAGVGFGSAGVHIPHACAYPIASLKHQYTPPGYPLDHPFVPHGWSVIVTAPAAFRFTYDADPERHHRVAELLHGEPIPDPGPDTLPEVLRTLMRDVGAPGGIAELGYTEDDVPALAEGALKQERLLVIAPKEAGLEDLAQILRASM